MSRKAVAGNSDDTFRELLARDEADSNEHEAATSGESRSNSKVAGGYQRSYAKEPSSSHAKPDTSETQAPSRRKKGTEEADSIVTATVGQTPDVSTAARWMLSLMKGGGAATLDSLDLDAQPSNMTSGQESSPGAAAQTGKANQEPMPLLDPKAIQTLGVDNAVNGATQGVIDATPFAELSLSPTATLASSIQKTPLKSDSTKPPVDSDSSSPSQSRANGNSVPEMQVGSIERGGGSTLDQSDGRDKTAVPVSKKKADTGGAPSDASAIALDRGGDLKGEITPPAASGVAGTQRVQSPDKSTAAVASILEPASTEPVKTPGSTVGSIELQVKVAGDKEVGLRFVERQGKVEIQMKSTDPQAVKALSDSLPGLKTSLNEGGWDVESRVQSRISPVIQSAQAGPSSERDSSPLAQFEFSNSSTRSSFGTLPMDTELQTRAAGERFGSPQSLRTEQISTGQMNRQGGSDSSSGQDQSHPDRDGSSNRDGQHGRNDSAGANSERQGRRPLRDAEAWLDSMESNLTRSSNRTVSTGVIK